MDIKTFFANAVNRGFRRIDANHPLNLFIGKDELGNFAFEMTGHFRMRKTPSSNSFSTRHVEDAGITSLFVILCDTEMVDLFCSFINDIVESTRKCDNDQSGYDLAVERIYSWFKMFRLSRQSLTEAQIKGLIGELIFLKDKMIPRFGELDALYSWTGPDKSKKDFSSGEMWWEVKSIDVGKQTIQISSIEQLHSDKEGRLVVIELEKLSEIADGINLYNISKEIYSSLISGEAKDRFLTCISEAGYDFSQQYNSYVYDLKNIKCYIVNNEFPKLTRDTCPIAIANARYDLSINEINSFLIDE